MKCTTKCIQKLRAKRHKVKTLTFTWKKGEGCKRGDREFRIFNINNTTEINIMHHPLWPGLCGIRCIMEYIEQTVRFKQAKSHSSINKQLLPGDWDRTQGVSLNNLPSPEQKKCWVKFIFIHALSKNGLQACVNGSLLSHGGDIFNPKNGCWGCDKRW